MVYNYVMLYFAPFYLYGAWKIFSIFVGHKLEQNESTGWKK